MIQHDLILDFFKVDRLIDFKIGQETHNVINGFYGKIKVIFSVFKEGT